MDKLKIIESKIIESESIHYWLSYWRFKSKIIVFTNGCFDILHRGHIEYLSKAAENGDVLVVGLNTDKSVKKIKGSGRPYQDQESRALILASLHFVTAVILFNEETPYELIKLIQPDVLVKGGDYKPEEIIGYDIVKAKGGKVVTVDYIDDYSTSGIIEKISFKNKQ
jgi:rfaE bifunctional protein nucleotidyltransferase chain/domain